jgi:predicted DNA-binding transcriptional regulator YafY
MADTFSKVEVIPGVARRRRFSTEQKLAVVAEYVFHPTLTLERQRDGSLIVLFRAGGLLEMCWHLYPWGANVEVLAPDELKAMLGKAHQHRNFVTSAA